MDAVVVGDVVSVVAQRAGVERQQPDGVHAQPGHVVQPLDESPEVAHPVLAGVLEGLDVQLVENGVLVPQRVGAQRGAPCVWLSGVCLVRALGRNVFAGAGLRGRTGPAVAGAVAGSASGVGAGRVCLARRCSRCCAGEVSVMRLRRPDLLTLDGYHAGTSKCGLLTWARSGVIRSVAFKILLRYLCNWQHPAADRLIHERGLVKQLRDNNCERQARGCAGAMVGNGVANNVREGWSTGNHIAA
jgi:hypothetical protein